MKKAQKSHLLTVRLNTTTHEAIEKSVHQYSSRDGASYTLNEVARYLLNAGLYSEGKLRELPALDGRGARSLQQFQRSQEQAQKQVKRLSARATALKAKFNLQGENA